jgi:hypothetical protein
MIIVYCKVTTLCSFMYKWCFGERAECGVKKEYYICDCITRFFITLLRRKLAGGSLILEGIILKWPIFYGYRPIWLLYPPPPPRYNNVFLTSGEHVLHCDGSLKGHAIPRIWAKILSCQLLSTTTAFVLYILWCLSPMPSHVRTLFRPLWYGEQPNAIARLLNLCCIFF